MITASRKAAVFKKPSTSSGGFSLLELVATIAVLSTLTAISAVGFNGRGGIIGQIKFANIDEAKALLNSAAADCLQKSRLNREDKDIIDESIISDQRIKSLGFSINKTDNADKCSYFQLIPTNENDDIRYPIGFSVSDGSLNKFATPSSSDQGSISSCERWAGLNCKQDEGLKQLIDWKNQIAVAKEACENEYSKWLNENNTQPLEFARWNPNADAGCPTKAPTDGSTSYQTDPSCTTNGCNRTVYGLDGEFVGFNREDYDRALETKYGKACTDWVNSKKLANYTNNPQDQPQELKECGSQEFWFYEGVDVGSQEEFNKRICSDNLEIEKRTSGKRTVEGCGSEIYYFCENQIKDSERDYKECSCEVEKYNRAQKGKNGAFTTTEKGATGCGDFWICNKEILSDQESYDNKCKPKATPKPPTSQECWEQTGGSPSRTCDKSKYYRVGKCKAYNQCMLRI